MFRAQLSLILFILLLAVNVDAQLLFEEESIPSGLIFEYKESLKMGGGAATFDFDNDGDDDIYIVGGQNPDGLFENDGSGNFIDVSSITNISAITSDIMTTSVVTGDIDNDGIREIFVGTIGDIGANFDAIRSNLLLKYNPTTSQYENIIQQALIADESFCMGGHFFDSNLDGYLDLYLINYVAQPKLIIEGSDVIGFDHECFENKLFINSGDGTFTDQTEFYGLEKIGCSLAATTSDLDWDGDPDIIIANDFGKWLEPNQLFQNEGEENPYSDISKQSNTNVQMYGMGIAVGDYDEDLDLDFYVTNIGENAFFKNQGDMNFQNVASELNIQNTITPNGLNTTGWGAILEDFNNDSYLDLFVSNGYVYSVVDIDDTEQMDELFIGSSNFDFTNITANSGINFQGPSRGALFGDWNSDGQLDIVTITNELTDESQNSINYYRNLNNGQNWVGFKLSGNPSNRDAFGAKILLHSGGRTLMRELRGGDSHASQSSTNIHFGLTNNQEVDSIQIFWPSGTLESYHDIQLSEYHTITEGMLLSTNNNLRKINFHVFPNPAKEQLHIEISSDISPPYQLRLFNSIGNQVYEKLLTTDKIQIDISSFPPGIYTAICSSTSQYITQPIILLSPN